MFDTSLCSSSNPSCEHFRDASRFEAFDIYDVVYKTVVGVDLMTSIMTPKGLRDVTCPLLVHFHGGGLIVGDRLWPEWFAKWFLQFGVNSKAIMLSPDYRLLPESSGHEILEDVRDFWTWVHECLPAELEKLGLGVKVDPSKIAAGGESAGGYLALESALLFPDAGIKAVISQYGVMDLDHPFNAQSCTPLEIEASRVRTYLDKTKNTIRIQSHPMATWNLVEAIQAEGCHRKFLLGSTGKDNRKFSVFPQKALEEAKHRLPAMWLFHGLKDDVLPVDCTRDFVKVLRETRPEVNVLEHLREGGHGFDVDLEMDQAGEAWIQEGCAFVSEFWLQ